MVKLVKRYIKEAKQVGLLYHFCTIDAVATYIAPTDTLSSSGNYKNWLLGGNTNAISFTRDKNFTVKTQRNQDPQLFVCLEIDGDKLSENYKIKPYNDLAFDSDTGVFDPYYEPEDLEKEEFVIGPIKRISTFITDVRLCITSLFITDVIENYDPLSSCLSYLKRFNLTYDSKLGSSFGLFTIPYPSVDNMIFSLSTLNDLYDGEKVESNKIDKSLAYFPKDYLMDSFFDLIKYSRKHTVLIKALEDYCLKI